MDEPSFHSRPKPERNRAETRMEETARSSDGSGALGISVVDECLGGRGIKKLEITHFEPMKPLSVDHIVPCTTYMGSFPTFPIHQLTAEDNAELMRDLSGRTARRLRDVLFHLASPNPGKTVGSFRVTKPCVITGVGLVVPDVVDLVLRRAEEDNDTPDAESSGWLRKVDFSEVVIVRDFLGGLVAGRTFYVRNLRDLLLLRWTRQALGSQRNALRVRFSVSFYRRLQNNGHFRLLEKANTFTHQFLRVALSPRQLLRTNITKSNTNGSLEFPSLICGFAKTSAVAVLRPLSNLRRKYPCWTRIGTICPSPI